jgi:hypothetical protein
VVHFIGDLHMPLHASENNDLGGNCVPVKYLRRVPTEHNHFYSPNLHALWDTAIIERDMEGAEPREYANFLEMLFETKTEAWRNAGIHVEDWAWESHDAAETVAYDNLVPKIPVESPVAMHSCTDANQIGDRMMALHVSADERYQSAAALVVEKRIAQAGVRLAMVLNEAATAVPVQ